MRLTLFAFGVIALSLHLHAWQAERTLGHATGGARVAMVSGNPVLIR